MRVIFNSSSWELVVVYFRAELSSVFLEWTAAVQNPNGDPWAFFRFRDKTTKLYIIFITFLYLLFPISCLDAFHFSGSGELLLCVSRHGFSGSEAEHGKVEESSGLQTKWNALSQSSCQHIKDKQKVGSETRHRAWIGDINKLTKNLDYSRNSEDFIEDNKCSFSFFFLN